MMGGVFAERSSSHLGERGDEVAISTVLVPGYPSAWYRVRIQQTHFLKVKKVAEAVRILLVTPLVLSVMVTV